VSEPPPLDPGDLTPVTIIGGYLGAGKTTLVNRLLSGHHGRRLAVLVNDFGAVNIDADLIAAHDGETISLENGCVCCSIADALGEGLDRVLTLDPLPDQIVVEASGVADPAKIAAYGQGWPGCRLDAVVVLADAETITRQADDQFVGELVTRQLQRADLVVLTKVDLVDPDRLDEVTDWVGTQAGVPIIAADHGNVDPALILDIGGSTAAGSAGAPTAAAESMFEAVILEPSGPVDRSAVEAALDRWPDEVVRVKGVLELIDHHGPPTPHLVQRVGRRWSLEPTVAGSATGQLVIIGRRRSINAADLQADLTD
jgi:G3E family GTPase